MSLKSIDIHEVLDNTMVILQGKIGEGIQFHTTKPPGEGAGLGLYISHNIIVQKHKGKLTVDSKPGETCFTVMLPVNLEA